MSRIENVLVEIEADGLVGIGYAFFFSEREADAVRLIIRDLAEGLEGKDPCAVRALYERMWRQVNWIGQSGLGVMALSTLDTALHDVRARCAGMPLYKFLGGERARLPAYATGGWVSQPIAEVIEEGLRFQAAGFKHYKIKVGSNDWRVDVERLTKLRDALGPEMDVMVDANQAWSAHEGLAASRALAECGVFWVEEPVHADDLRGAARIVSAIDVPLAAGENLYGVPAFSSLVDARAADILMPDLMRCGGPTGFLRVCDMADAHCLPVSSHTFSEISAHLMSAVANGTLVECIPGWWDEMFDEGPRLSNGAFELSDQPGLGMTFSDRAKRQSA